MGSAAVQGALWGGAPADWADLAEPTGVPVYAAVFEALGIGEGTRLLDVGCGAGLALQMASERGATVHGVDASAGLLGIAHQRLPEADLHEGDLEDLPFDDATFDVVTSFNAVQYAADPVAALREVRRVARPGSQAAVVVWAEAERCETRSVMAAVGSLLPPPPPGAQGPFALSAPGKLEELLASAGLVPKTSGEVPSRFVFADLDTAVRGHLSAGPGRMAIQHAGIDAVERTLREALQDSIQADGTSRQENAFRYVIAIA